MQIGMIGLGRMGSNMLRRLQQGEQECVVYDRDADAVMARREHTAQARKYLQAIHQANAMTMEDQPWSFPEFVHGQKLTPGGTRHQGWSAAAAIIGRHTLEGQPIFRISGYET